MIHIEALKEQLFILMAIGANRIGRDSIKDILDDWDLLRKRVLSCKKCPLFHSRNRVVFGEGREDAPVMIIGEAPGKEEDIKGRPFIGPSGDLLERMMAAIKLDRKDAFITSAVKCRPPRNRTPLSGEIRACSSYLFEQIRIISPKAILCLGEVASRIVTGKKRRTLKEIRGKVHIIHISDMKDNEARSVKAVATYHPAYILRFQNSYRERTIKKEAWEDLRLFKASY